MLVEFTAPVVPCEAASVLPGTQSLATAMAKGSVIPRVDTAKGDF